MAASEEFQALVDRYVREVCSEHPEAASFCGLTEWDHQSADLSAAGFQRRRDSDRRWLRAFEDVDPEALVDEQRVDRELVLARLGVAVANADYEGWRRSPEAYIVSGGVFELFVHRARPEGEAVDAAVDRLGRIPDQVAAARANLSADLAHPRLLRRDIASALGQARFLREELAEFVAGASPRERLAAAAEPAAAAMVELAQYLDGLASRAHGDITYGRVRYDNLLRIGEQLDISTPELREMGWREYRAIDEQMAEVAHRVDGTRDWKRVHARLQREHAPDMQGMLDEYAEATARARRFVRDRDLMTLPDGERCDVRAAPGFLASTVVASYFPAAPFLPGSHGRFNVPFTGEGASATEMEDRLRSNCHHEIPATAVHEAYGGHHAHFVHMANANPLRQFVQSDYFIEGWALYFEKVAFEHGFYRTDEEVLGWLAGRIMRAARVIVDTSLHVGDMTIDDVSRFMREMVGLPDAVAHGEAERYAAWPTQASAYLTGALAIEASRDRWLAERRGSLRQFHDAITDSGALPPGLAARTVGLGAPGASM